MPPDFFRMPFSGCFDNDKLLGGPSRKADASSSPGNQWHTVHRTASFCKKKKKKTRVEDTEEEFHFTCKFTTCHYLMVTSHPRWRILSDGY